MTSWTNAQQKSVQRRPLGHNEVEGSRGNLAVWSLFIKGYRPCRRPPLSYWNPCEELHLLTMSPESLTLRTDALKKQVLCHTYPLQKPALRVHWLVPKQPNNSRNRAQHAFPAQRPESLTLRTDALKKQVLCHTPCRNQLWESIGWFRNSRTAAGFVPNMPSQRSAPNL